MNAAHVVVEPTPRSGAWNMAIDEALLTAAVENSTTTLRFYRWEEATVSLGYFQKTESASLDPLLAELPLVRRLSGGGAILHEHEWTYSLSVPSDHSLSKQAIQLYSRVHDCIIAALGNADISAAMRGDVDLTKATNPASEPFLCFGRGDERDIIVAGHKVLGSAQRRRRGAILQHGSLLLRRSKYALQFPGLEDLVEAPFSVDELMQDVVGQLAQMMGTDVIGSDFGADVETAAGTLVSQRYQQTDWRVSPGN
ncbi:MAG: lipoate--protein ligase [Planctomycetaceae bacterium]|nr:lipoate--protein ligase [Planctomycetaceae bacterium]